MRERERELDGRRPPSFLPSSMQGREEKVIQGYRNMVAVAGLGGDKDLVLQVEPFFLGVKKLLARDIFEDSPQLRDGAKL